MFLEKDNKNEEVELLARITAAIIVYAVIISVGNIYWLTETFGKFVTVYVSVFLAIIIIPLIIGYGKKLSQKQLVTLCAIVVVIGVVVMFVFNKAIYDFLYYNRWLQNLHGFYRSIFGTTM